MTSFSFSGVFSVMITPFDQSGDINLETVRQLVEFYIERGVDGLFPCGSAGEGVHLTLEQRIALAEAVVKQVAGRVPVIPGVIASNARDAVRLAKAYRGVGCSGIVLTPPIYYRFQEDYIEQYFNTVLEEAGLPVVLYNIPAYAQPLTPAMLAKMVRHPSVVGVKDSSGSMVDLLNFLHAMGGREIGLMSGREEMLFTCLAAGGSGSMSAVNAVVPEIMTSIRDDFRAGRFEESRHAQNALIPLIQALYAPQLPLGFRHALTLRGFQMGDPVHAVPQSLKAKTESLLADIKTELEKSL